MTSTVADHYEKHLGPIYTWMVGGVDAAISRGDAELDALPLPSKTGGTAVDLGAGFGMHAIPLARRGFSVVAIDSHDPLFKELLSRKGAHPTHTDNSALLPSPTPTHAPPHH